MRGPHAGQVTVAAQAVASQTGTQAEASVAAVQAVPTIGSPRYSDNNATGGQDVKFFDAGISAIVVGRTVFIWGAEIVQSTEEFTLIEGARHWFDGAVIRQEPPQVSQDPLTDGLDQLFAPLKLEFEPDTTVTLSLYSIATNPDNPDRELRNWTFRVR